jgi:hypothetical protein
MAHESKLDEIIPRIAGKQVTPSSDTPGCLGAIDDSMTIGPRDKLIGMTAARRR